MSAYVCIHMCVYVHKYECVCKCSCVLVSIHIMYVVSRHNLVLKPSLLWNLATFKSNKCYYYYYKMQYLSVYMYIC